jgi:hypothetical protein
MFNNSLRLIRMMEEDGPSGQRQKMRRIGWTPISGVF